MGRTRNGANLRNGSGPVNGECFVLVNAVVDAERELWKVVHYGRRRKVKRLWDRKEIAGCVYCLLQTRPRGSACAASGAEAFAAF